MNLNILTRCVTQKVIYRWFSGCIKRSAVGNLCLLSNGLEVPWASSSLVCPRDVRTYSAGRSSHRDGKHKKDSKVKLLSDEELAQVIDVDHFKSQLSRTVDKMKEEYTKHLNVRTSAGAIESLKVNFENEEYTLNELAQISRKNPKMLVVNMVNSPQAIQAVLDAISKSGFNLNPQQEGTTLYVPIPPLTREHRENLSKNAKALFVRTSDELRDIQNEVIRSVRKKKANFSEDLIYNAQQQIMKITHDYVSDCEGLMLKKQTELVGKDG